MSYYDDIDQSVLRDQSFSAQMRRNLMGTHFQGRPVKAIAGGLASAIVGLVFYLTCMVLLFAQGLWLIAVGFLAISLLEGQLPGSSKFLGDVGCLVLCYLVWQSGFGFLALALTIGAYALLFLTMYFYYGDCFHQQKAYLRGLNSKEYRLQQLNI